MTYPTTGSETELRAVNQILMSVGQAPVTRIEKTNPDVAICFETLMEVSREVQSEGWTFNREYGVAFTPDANKNIKYPKNALAIDISNSYVQSAGNGTAVGFNGRKYDTVKRGDKVYDRRRHSYDWDETIYCDVKWLWDWDELPIPIQDYITAKAATVVSSRIVGDPNQYQILQQKEAYMRAWVIEYETQQGDYNYMHDPRYEDNYRHYEPMDVLRRY